MCNVNTAMVHLTLKTEAGVKVSRHYCSECAEGLDASGSGEALVLFPWEEDGPWPFSFSGRIVGVEGDVAILETMRSSHCAPGFRWRIWSKYVPSLMRRVGGQFAFNCSVRTVSSVSPDPPA